MFSLYSTVLCIPMLKIKLVSKYIACRFVTDPFIYTHIYHNSELINSLVCPEDGGRRKQGTSTTILFFYQIRCDGRNRNDKFDFVGAKTIF